MTTIIEKPATTTVSGAAQMRAADRAAEARANAPAVPLTPASLRKPDHPRQAELMAEANAIRQEAEANSIRADNLTVQARLTGQKIDSLEREKSELLNRLSVIEGRDLKAERESSRQTIHRLYGYPTLTAPERETLNFAVISLAWSPLLEKEIPAIKKDLQTRLGEVEAQLASLTASASTK